MYEFFFCYRYIKGSTGKSVKGAQSPSIKPPDLWIHHDQMELKSMEKSSQGSLDTSSGCGQGSTNTYDGPDTRVTIHHVPQSTNSLEKSNYVSSYVGMYLFNFDKIVIVLYSNVPSVKI